MPRNFSAIWHTLDENERHYCHNTLQRFVRQSIDIELLPFQDMFVVLQSIDNYEKFWMPNTLPSLKRLSNFTLPTRPPAYWQRLSILKLDPELWKGRLPEGAVVTTRPIIKFRLYKSKWGESVWSIGSTDYEAWAIEMIELKLSEHYKQPIEAW